MIEMWWSRSAEVVGTLMCHPDPPHTHRFPLQEGGTCYLSCWELREDDPYLSALSDDYLWLNKIALPSVTSLSGDSPLPMMDKGTAVWGVLLAPELTVQQSNPAAGTTCIFSNSLFPVLLAFPLFHRYWAQEHSLRNRPHANLLISLHPRETNLPQPTGRIWEAQEFGSPPPPVHSIYSVFSQHIAPRFLGCPLCLHFSTLGLNLYSFFETYTECELCVSFPCQLGEINSPSVVSQLCVHTCATYIVPLHFILVICYSSLLDCIFLEDLSFVRRSSYEVSQSFPENIGFKRDLAGL